MHDNGMIIWGDGTSGRRFLTHTHTRTHKSCWEQGMTGGCVMQITCEQHQNSSKQQSPSRL